MCSFNSESCDVNCAKFPICSFYAVQAQLNHVQSQLNFLLETLKTVLESNETTELKVNLLEEVLRKAITEKQKGSENEN